MRLPLTKVAAPHAYARRLQLLGTGDQHGEGEQGQAGHDHTTTNLHAGVSDLAVKQVHQGRKCALGKAQSMDQGEARSAAINQ